MSVEDTYVREISMVLDNDERTHNEVREAVMEALRFQSGYSEMSPDHFEDAIRQGREYEFSDVVGGAVEDVILDHIEQEASGIAADLLRELTQGLTEHLGRAYIPTPDDYRDWYESN